MPEGKYQSRTKQESRENILEAFKEISGLSKVPRNRSYITLCETRDEMDQLLNGHLEEPQIIGINTSEKVIRKLKKEYPKAQFYAGHLTDILRMLRNQSKLNPAIINCDFTRTIKMESRTITTVIVAHKKVKRVVVAINTIIKCPWNKREIKKEDCVEELRDILYMQPEWSIHKEGFYYSNGRTNRTKMLTLFISKGYQKR